MPSRAPWSQERDREWGQRLGLVADPFANRGRSDVPDEARACARDADTYDATPFGYGAGYGREGLRAHRRDWWDQTRDELATWIGDRDAERRRAWDRLQAGHRGRGPRSYLRADARIHEDVCERLTDDVSLDASDVEVAVQDGEVTLEGTVEARQDKHRAEDLADDTPGVRHVQNNLRVRVR